MPNWRHEPDQQNPQNEHPGQYKTRPASNSFSQVEVPTLITLDVLHDVIQIAMGWLDRHFWEFRIGKQRYGLPMDEDWGAVPCIEATEVCLHDVLKPRKTMFDYLYDFGDAWEHRLTVTNIRQGEPSASYPRHIAGEWAGPPEDCGGIACF